MRKFYKVGFTYVYSGRETASKITKNTLVTRNNMSSSLDAMNFQKWENFSRSPFRLVFYSFMISNSSSELTTKKPSRAKLNFGSTAKAK